MTLKCKYFSDIDFNDGTSSHTSFFLQAIIKSSNVLQFTRTKLIDYRRIIKFNSIF